MAIASQSRLSPHRQPAGIEAGDRRLLAGNAASRKSSKPPPADSAAGIGSFSGTPGIEHIPSGDFSLYDHVLDTAVMVGADPRSVPRRPGAAVDLDTYFAMARGPRPKLTLPRCPARPLEMTKWFDTNYHFLVPRVRARPVFRLASTGPLDAFREALELGIHTRPVLLGPVSFLLLGKSRWPAAQPRWTLLDGLVRVYEEVLAGWRPRGPTGCRSTSRCWPSTCRPKPRGPGLRLRDGWRPFPSESASAWRRTSAAWRKPCRCAPPAGGCCSLGSGSRPEQLAPALDLLPRARCSRWGSSTAGTSGGATCRGQRTCWPRRPGGLGRNGSSSAPPARCCTAPSTWSWSTGWMPSCWAGWPSPGRSSMRSRAGPRAVYAGPGAVHDAWPRVTGLATTGRFAAGPPQRGQGPPGGRHAGDAPPRQPVRPRRGRSNRHPPSALAAGHHHRLLPADSRGPQGAGRTQARRVAGGAIRRVLPPPDRRGRPLPGANRPGRARTRRVRAATTWSSTSASSWKASPSPPTAGCRATAPRCVKPPVIYGDVSRPRPMTVDWSRYAQSLSSRPMKGMLTGPVTILQWSFVRDDQPRRGHRHADRPGHPRRGGGPGGGRHPRDPDRRAGPARGHAAGPRGTGGLSPLGRGRLPPGDLRAWPITRKSTRTCATATSTTSSMRSPSWTPT